MRSLIAVLYALLPNLVCLSCQTKTPRLSLPVELIENIFELLYCRLNPDPSRWWDTAYISNRTFIKVSLVCKEWHLLAKRHRNAIFIGSEKGAKRFLSTFRKASVNIDKLHYDVKIPVEILNKMLPLLNRRLTALSIPVDMLQSKHIYDLLKNPETNHSIQSFHIYGKLADDYQGSWWKRAYFMHNVPTLRELSLTNLFIKGTVTEISAAVLSPISKISFERLRFQSPAAIEHLCRHILYNVEDVKLSGLLTEDENDVLTYFGTSWVGLKRIELLKNSVSTTIDTRLERASANNCIQDEETMEKMKAFFRLCRKLKFETSRSIGFLPNVMKILKSENSLSLPREFKLRKELEEDELKQFRRDHALLTGSSDFTLIDPPEFFDIYGEALEAQWNAGESW